MFHFTRRSAAWAIALIFAMAACSSGETTPKVSDAHPSASVAPSMPESPGASAGPAMVDQSLGVEVAVDGLTEPTNLAFLGADDFFVIEKSTGHVIRVRSGEASEPVLDLAVNFFDERGLLGIALHPEFDSNGYVYLYWTASAEGTGDEGRLGEDTDEATALPALANRVERFVWNGTALTWDKNIVQL